MSGMTYGDLLCAIECACEDAGTALMLRSNPVNNTAEYVTEIAMVGPSQEFVATLDRLVVNSDSGDSGRNGNVGSLELSVRFTRGPGIVSPESIASLMYAAHQVVVNLGRGSVKATPMFVTYEDGRAHVHAKLVTVMAPVPASEEDEDQSD